jgi:hypothetical protein
MLSGVAVSRKAMWCLRHAAKTRSRLLHLRWIGIARDRDIAERETEIAGTHFGKAEPRRRDDLLAISDTLGAFQLDPEKEFAVPAERP